MASQASPALTGAHRRPPLTPALAPLTPAPPPATGALACLGAYDEADSPRLALSECMRLGALPR